MKKSLFFAGLAAALSLVGCNKETDVKGLDGRPVEIVLSDVATRTVNDDMSTKWVNGDALNVFYAPAGTTDYSSNVEFKVDDAENNHAKGTAELTADAYDWYLLYPYSKYVTTPANTNGRTYIGSRSDYTQKQAAYGSKAHLAGGDAISCFPVYGLVKNVSVSATPVVEMKQVASVLAVNVKNESGKNLTIEKVSFTAPEFIVGNFYIDFAQEPLSITAYETQASKTAEVEVTEPGVLANGETATLYMGIKPFTAKSGSKLSLKVTADQGVFEKTITLPADVQFKSGYIKQINVSYTSGTAIPGSTLAEITAMENNTDVQTNEVLVVAKYARGIMLAENGSYLLAFNNNGVTGEIGEIVTVSGKVGEYAGLKQIASPEVTVVSSGNEVVLPAPKVIANLDDYASDKVELIQFTGTLAASDKYFNVNVTGSTRLGSIQYPLDAEVLKALDKKPITATGFFTGITGGGNYVNMMSTSVEEAVVNVFDVTPLQIDVAATATTAEISVAGNVDWTVEPSEGASVDKTSGSGSGVITVSFPANTDTENTKEYTVFVRTEATGVNDEFEVNITQAKADAVDENDAVFVFGEMGLVNETAYTENPFTKNGVSVQFGGGGNNGKYYNTGSGIRIYANGTITISSQNTITKIAYVFQETTGTSGSGSNQITFNTYPIADDWTVNSGAFTYGANSEWTGAAASVVLTRADGKGHWRLQKVIVTCDDTPAPAASLSSISVSGQKKEFNVGDEFSHDTAVVTATYSDNSTKDVTTAATFSTPDMTTAGTKTVTVSYTENEVTKTTTYDITVAEAQQLGEGEYSFTITVADFNSDSYTANNGEHTSTATASNGQTKTITWKSNQVMKQASVMQWQKNNGYIESVTNLGTIVSIDIESTAGEFTTTKEDGAFKISVGGATGKTTKITVVFK